MKILITGGTGLIGKRLMPLLHQHGHEVTVLSRRQLRPADLPHYVQFARWDGKTTEGWGELVHEMDAIINLAGAGVADKRWTAQRKQVIRQSRLDAGQAMVAAIKAADRKPQVLLQSSAIGYYGDGQDRLIDESSPAGDDFLAQVCVDWENSTDVVEEMGVRRVLLRTGVVLDEEGGALAKMLPPFKMGVGGPIGSGQQWMPWIHWFDEIEAIRFLLENENANGAFNLVAPNPVKNKDFGSDLGRAVNRPAILPIPGFALHILFGELAVVLLTGQRAMPQRLLDAGFTFRHVDLAGAFNEILG